MTELFFMAGFCRSLQWGALLRPCKPGNKLPGYSQSSRWDDAFEADAGFRTGNVELQTVFSEVGSANIGSENAPPPFIAK
jgi:hypothetical protein